MVKLNSNLESLSENYLFVEVARRKQEYAKKNPFAKIISMGIGDVTLPLSKVVVDEMKRAAETLSFKATFKGYPPYEGYEFLREAISEKYKSLGVKIGTGEIYVSDGSKSDASNILDIFNRHSEVLIIDPVYPVYRDSSIINGNKVRYLRATEENNFLPMPYEGLLGDLIYLCSPNNPTGAVYSKEQLKKWVDFANQNRRIIIFDAAYEAFIEDKNLPHSIYEIEGAKSCAMEVCSFSKSAGFTGVRCAYTVIPKELEVNGHSVGKAWLRRQSVKFNGVSYVTQKAACASLTSEGKKGVLECISYYKTNARILSEAIGKLGLWHIGGENSPYIWFKCPKGMTSWEMFDFLLREANIVCTPGSGFGESGEGFIRLSSFAAHEEALYAAQRLKELKI